MTDVDAPAPPVDAPGPTGWGPAGPTGWTPSAAARAGRRPGVRVVALVLGGLFTVLVLAVTGYATANVLVRTSERDATTLEGRVVRAVIEVDGSVDVRPGPAGRAHVARRSSFGFSRPEVTETLVDGLLTVRATCSGIPGICSTDVDVDVPETTAVTIRSDRVSVVGLAGRVEVDAEGGSVELVDLSGPIEARAGGGAVTGEGLESPEVRASVGAGAVDLQFARPPSEVDASTGAGALAVVVPPDETAYRVDASTGTGSRDISVATDPTSPRRIRVSTGAGSVEVRYGTS